MRTWRPCPKSWTSFALNCTETFRYIDACLDPFLIFQYFFKVLVTTAETVDLSESRQTEVLIVAWVMTGAAILTVGIKLFARARIILVIGWDDFLIFLSLV
jgi:hypothetical protein